MTPRFKFWLIISFVAVFLAGGILGFFAERLLVHRGFPPRREGPSFPSFDKWAQDLNLTEDQRTKIREVFKQSDEKMRQLRTRYHSDLGAIQAEVRKEIDAILTPEQRAKLQAMIQEHLAKRKKERDRVPEKERYPERKMDFPK